MPAEQKNMAKYEIYKTMYENLTKAMKHGFYYEAIFIEYAILEDRTTSILSHAGQSTTDRSGHPLKLSKKIGILKSKEPFTSTYIRKRLAYELLDDVDTWRDARNALIHDLANTPYDSAHVKTIAEEGELLCKTFSNKSKNVNRYFDSQTKEK